MHSPNFHQPNTMSSLSKNVLQLFLVMLLGFSMTLFTVAADLTPKNDSATRPNFLDRKMARVTIFNDLGEGLNLTVHCKSGHSDLGVHKVAYPKGFFAFNFRPNFFGTTLYFCGFRWPDSPLHMFDIYVFQRDREVCGKCFWKIREDGPCMFNYETKEYDLCSNWNNRRKF